MHPISLITVKVILSGTRGSRVYCTDDPRKIQKSVISVFKEIINEYASMAPIDSDYKIIFIDSSGKL